MILAHWRASSRRAGMGATEATCCAHTGAPDRLDRAAPGGCSATGPTSCRCGAELALSAALQGPSTRAGGLRIPPVEPRIVPQALRSDSRHPLCMLPALNLGPCQLPRGVGVGQFPSGARLVVPWSRAHTGAPDRLDRAAPGGCSATGPTSCRCGAELTLSAALQGPSTRAGGLRIPPAEPRIVPQTLRSDSRHPLCMPPALNLGPCQLPGGGGVGQFPSGARLVVPCPHGRPGPARPRRAQWLQRHRADILPVRRGTDALSGPARPLHASGWSLDTPC